MDTIKLSAQPRAVTGRKVKKLREEGILPANVYGKKIKSESLQINAKEFEEAYKKAGETGIVSLIIESKGKKEEKPTLIDNVQVHPVMDVTVHVDFRQVDLKEKIEASVPVEIEGESPAEKQSLGTVVQYVNEIEVEALPADLPERFVLDISSLEEVDQAIYLKDIKIDKSKVELKGDAETILVKVEPPQKEEEVAPPAEASAAEAPAEGEVPAEGEATGEQPKEEETSAQPSES